MARTQNIKSNGLTYSIPLMDRVAYGDRLREAGSIWEVTTTPRSMPTQVATDARTLLISDQTRAGVISTTIPFIGFDFRLDNAGRSDNTGRAEQPVNNIKRVLSATLSARFELLSGNNTISFGCIPKTNFEVDRSGNFNPTRSALYISRILGWNQPRSGLEGSGRFEPSAITDSQALRRGDGIYEFDLKPRMLIALRNAMREKQVFGLVGMPFTLLQKSNYSAPPRFTPRDPNVVRIDNRLASAPTLTIKYTLNNNRINQGVGISRTSKSGFMEGNVFCGTNSGFGN